MNARFSRRAALWAGGTFGLASAAAHAAEDKPAAAGGGFFGTDFQVAAPKYVQLKSFATNVSPDRLAFTVLFDSLTVEAGGKSPDAVTTATLRVPFALPAGSRLVGFSNDIRGYVQKTKGSRVALLADIGGATAVFDQPATQDEAVARNFTRSCFADDRREGAAGESRTYAINLFLTAWSPGGNESALLTVDSLDVEAILYSAATAKHPKTPAKPRTR